MGKQIYGGENDTPTNLKVVKACSDVKIDETLHVALNVLLVFLEVKGNLEYIITITALDSCSSACFVTENLITKLKVERQKKNIQIATIFSKKSTLSTVINNVESLDLKYIEKKLSDKHLFLIILAKL